MKIQLEKKHIYLFLALISIFLFEKSMQNEAFCPTIKINNGQCSASSTATVGDSKCPISDSNPVPCINITVYDHPTGYACHCGDSKVYNHSSHECKQSSECCMESPTATWNEDKRVCYKKPWVPESSLTWEEAKQICHNRYTKEGFVGRLPHFNDNTDLQQFQQNTRFVTFFPHILWTALKNYSSLLWHSMNLCGEPLTRDFQTNNPISISGNVFGGCIYLDRNSHELLTDYYCSLSQPVLCEVFADACISSPCLSIENCIPEPRGFQCVNKSYPNRRGCYDSISPVITEPQPPIHSITTSENISDPIRNSSTDDSKTNSCKVVTVTIHCETNSTNCVICEESTCDEFDCYVFDISSNSTMTEPIIRATLNAYTQTELTNRRNLCHSTNITIYCTPDCVGHVICEEHSCYCTANDKVFSECIGECGFGYKYMEIEPDGLCSNATDDQYKIVTCEMPHTCYKGIRLDEHGHERMFDNQQKCKRRGGFFTGSICAEVLPVIEQISTGGSQWKNIFPTCQSKGMQPAIMLDGEFSIDIMISFLFRKYPGLKMWLPLKAGKGKSQYHWMSNDKEEFSDVLFDLDPPDFTLGENKTMCLTISSIENGTLRNTTGIAIKQWRPCSAPLPDVRHVLCYRGYPYSKFTVFSEHKILPTKEDPYKLVLGTHQDISLEKCDRKCRDMPKCLSYNYDAKWKRLCVLMRVSARMARKFKGQQLFWAFRSPNYQSWHKLF